MLLLFLGSILAFGLAGCGGSSTPTGSGSLSVNNGEALQIAPNVAYSVPVSLKPSAAVAALPVTFAILPAAVAAEPVAATTVRVAITSSDPTIASVYPSTCHLSSEAGQDTCHVTVRGLTTGVVSLLATAPGYAAAAAPAAIRIAATPNYGRIQLGAFPSARPPSTSNFTMTAQQGDTVTLAASITNFDTPLDGVPILLTITSGGGSIVGNPQCNVDSAADARHYCVYKIKLPSAPGTVTVAAKAVGSVAGDFSNQPTVTINVQANPVPGTIVLQSADGVVPLGMSSPFWAVLQDSSGVGDTVVTVSGSTNVTINPAISATSGAYQAQSCTLSSSSPVCGFGVKGNVLGAATVSATAGSGGYTVKALNLSVNPQLTTSRTITFQNNDSGTVWVGITGGTATSYMTRDMVTTVNPQTNGANVTCGPTNPGGGCPTGSTCRQGGASPAPATAYFCYWDQPVPTSGYQIASTGTKQTSISISDSSYDRIADITWSGNAYPRQGCTVLSSGQLQCEIADCGNATSGSACAPGTGGAPGIATLAEFTLQRHNTDYYDISIIGGANVATTFGPTPAAPSSTAYFCATAGATTAQVQGSTTLLASDWNMAGHVQTIFTGSTPYSVTGQTAGSQSTAYYHYIATPSGGRTGVGCATGSACTGGLVCGYDKNAVNNGSNSDYQTSCGTHLVWLSANAIGALNTAATNAAPFSFNTQIYNTTAAGAVKTASLYLCNASTNQSGYNAEDASTACGCTNWGSSYSIAGDAAFPSQFATPTAACVTNNNAGGTYYWTKSVLPTIAWMKRSCPTCYTYPFDDKSSTFQCASAARPNSINYLVQFNGTIPGQ